MVAIRFLQIELPEKRYIIERLLGFFYTGQILPVSQSLIEGATAVAPSAADVLLEELIAADRYCVARLKCK